MTLGSWSQSDRDLLIQRDDVVTVTRLLRFAFPHCLLFGIGSDVYNDVCNSTHLDIMLDWSWPFFSCKISKCVPPYDSEDPI